jgi:hypothetical protein
MDQEKFDQHLMDYLFDELDEVTSAAMKRKIEADADCREMVLGLRATIEVAGQLPMEEPSDDLEDRILAAASRAREREPWSRKLLRSLSWAGSHAMRPQLAMAAMLVLVVGSSLLLLRVRTGAVSSVTPTKDEGSMAAGPESDHAKAPATQRDPAKPQMAQVNEDGTPDTPAPDASAAATTQPRPQASDAPLTEEQLALIDKQFDAAMASYNSGNHRAAQQKFAEIKATKSPRAGAAALYEARAVRAHSGCKAAVPYYNAVRASGGAMAADATWEQADCHRILGEAAQARTLYLTLRNNKSYSARANEELEKQGETANSGGEGSASRLRNQANEPPKQQKNAPPANQAPQQQQPED